MNSHELFVEKKLKKVSEFIPPNSKILDIGCGEGKILDYLQTPEYYGIDGDKNLIENLTKKGIKAKIINLNKQKLPFKSEEFDFILMLDILEHLANPSELLEKSKKLLKKEGKLIITLPNDYHLLNKIRFIFNKHLTEDPFAPFGHMHYFPISSGKKFLIKNNLKIKNQIILSPIKPLFIPNFIKRFLSKNFPQSFARDVLYVLEPNYLIKG